MTIYRYYTLHRPPMLGGVPKENLFNIGEYETPQQTNRGIVYGYVDYTAPLTQEEIDRYELWDTNG